MKRIQSFLSAIAAAAVLLLSFPIGAIAAPSATGIGGTGTTSPSGILYGDNGVTTHLNTTSIGTGVSFSGGILSNTGLITVSCPGGFLTCSGTNPVSFVLGTLGVSNGGTGSTTLSGILKGNGTNAVGTLAIGSGLTYDGTTLSATGSGGTGSGNVATSSAETSGQVPFWSSTSATPATLSGGSSLFVWDNANGRLGVGTTTPSARLSVKGPDTTTGRAFVISDSSNNERFAVQDSGLVTRTIDASTFWKEVQRNTSYVGFLGNGSDYFLSYDTANERVAIGNSGSAGSTLSVSNNAGIGAAYALLAAPSNGLIVQGNTGIGTSTPSMNFSVQGNGIFSNNLSVAGLTATGTVSFTGLTSNAAVLTSGGTGTLGSFTGTSCINQFVRSLSGAIAATCATVGAADVSLAALTATDSTLTFSGSYNGSTARTIGINLTQPNTWTGLAQFNGNASTTGFTNSGQTWLTALGTAAGTFLAVDPNGKVIATTSPSGSSFSGTVGQVDYFTGTNIAAGTSTIVIATNKNVGVSTTTPSKPFSVGGDAVIGASSAGGTLGDLYVSKLGTAAGTFVAADATGKLIATTTPAGPSHANGFTSRLFTSSSGTEVITHNLGHVPKFIQMVASGQGISAAESLYDSGSYNGSTYSNAGIQMHEGGSSASSDTAYSDATNLLTTYADAGLAGSLTATISAMDSTTFTISWTKGGSPGAGGINVAWNAE